MQLVGPIFFFALGTRQTIGSPGDLVVAMDAGNAELGKWGREIHELKNAENG